MKYNGHSILKKGHHSVVDHVLGIANDSGFNLCYEQDLQR